MKILVIFLLISIPNICFAQEDFWGNELRDGDKVHILNHEHIKGEYIENGNYIQLENGDILEMYEEDIEQG